MTKQSLIVRKEYCQQHKLCFISLRPYSEPLGLVKHSDVDLVLVNKEYEEVRHVSKTN